MKFSDVIGQDSVKNRLRQMVGENRVPHALMFCGPDGCGKLPVALAFAGYLLCCNRNESEACGVCKPCKIYGREWRDMISRNPYFSKREWLDRINAGNSQMTIYSAEADEIVRKLSLAPAFGKYKVMIVWLPEKMQEACANKLLKFLEEPVGDTVFLFVTENRDMLLQTVVSRMQIVEMGRVADAEIKDMLTTRYGVQGEQADEIVRLASGNVIRALETIYVDDEAKRFFDWFVSLMRLSYQRKIKEMKAWSDSVAETGRETQKKFLGYCQNMIRENFIYNLHVPQLNYMSRSESEFARRFAPFVNEKNVMDIMRKLSDAERDIERNVNAKMVFFDLALNMIVEIAVKGRA